MGTSHVPFPIPAPLFLPMYINPGVNDLRRKQHKEEMKNAHEKNVHLVDDTKTSFFFLNILRKSIYSSYPRVLIFYMYVLYFYKNVKIRFRFYILKNKLFIFTVTNLLFIILFFMINLNIFLWWVCRKYQTSMLEEWFFY